MRPRVFVTQPIAASALERLRGLADVTINSDPVRIVSVDELSAAAGATARQPARANERARPSLSG